MELIMWLDELRIHDAMSVGDAAASLGELTTAGITVADGFVLSPQVLRFMLIGAGVDPSRPCPDEIGDTAWLRARLLDARIEPCAVAQLVAAYRHLGARTGLVDPAVVLRPSVLGKQAGAERGGRAIAVGSTAMTESVRGVWSSLFDPGFLADRAALRIAAVPSAAVLIQHVVPVLRSGAAFTSDPLCPSRDVVMIEAAFGNGPDVWTGPPWDEYRVDRSTLEVVQTQIAAKEMEEVFAGGRATAVPLPAGHRHTRVLTDHEATSVARTALDVEDVLGGPQVVDFALTPAGDVLVRGARPLELAQLDHVSN
jgi:phosphoenolpyruvate synthase/pyruvate phosphate dikinase